jgi:hypothetical protein
VALRERRALNTRLFRRIFITVALLCATAMIVSAARRHGVYASTAAAVFALSATVAAVLSNFEAWRLAPPTETRSATVRTFWAIRRNTQIAAIAYAWGALTMQGIYLTPLTGLRWQHGWQYAAAMALLSGGCALFVRTLRPPVAGADPRGWQTHFRLAKPLALAQAGLAAGSLAVLSLSGKMAGQRADWAANRVFAALAVAVLAISIAAAVSIARARQRP